MVRRRARRTWHRRRSADLPEQRHSEQTDQMSAQPAPEYEGEPRPHLIEPVQLADCLAEVADQLVAQADVPKAAP